MPSASTANLTNKRSFYAILFLKEKEPVQALFPIGPSRWAAHRWRRCSASPVPRLQDPLKSWDACEGVLAMLDVRRGMCCVESEALVLVEVMPLCCIDPLEAAVLAMRVEAAADSDLSSIGLPVRCAAVMPCATAFALAEGVGDVVF